MFRFRFLLLALVAVAPTVGSAQRFLIEWDERCWEVGGDALYWRPFTRAYQYGVDVQELSNERVEARDLRVRPDYDWGFRLGGSTYTHDCCHLFFADWYYLRTTDSAAYASDQLVLFPVSDDFEGRIAASVKTRYNRVNIRAGRYVSAHCQSLGYIYGGLRYVDIERRQRATLTAEDNGPVTITTDEKSRFEGAAFEVGYGAHVTEPCGFSLIGHVSGLMGVGQRTNRQTLSGENGDSVAIEFVTPGKSACIVGAELRLGLQWRYECGCYWLLLEAGYEAHQYWDAWRFMIPVLGAESEFIRGTELVNAGFGGPFFGASVRF